MDRIEILTIGDELIEGRLVDTNAGWMSQRLTDAGLQVAGHRSVGDDPGDIEHALRSAATTAAAVLVSGGLGPTTDDLTARCAAAAAGVATVSHPEALAHVEAFFASRGRPMSANNAQQADLPVGCTLLPNPNGTAVGFRLEIEGTPSFFMPGVPRELKSMFDNHVLPELRSRLVADPPLTTELKIFGLGESDVGQRLQDLGAGLVPPAALLIQYRATFPEIHVRLGLRGSDDAGMAILVDEARSRLGHHVFAVGPAPCRTTLAEVLVAELTTAGATVATAEALTTGRVTALLHDAAGAEDVFVGGEISPFPSNVAAERAAEVRRRFGATFGVATTGGATAHDVVLVVDSGNDTPTIREIRFPIDRKRLRILAAHAALALVRRHCQVLRQDDRS